MLVASVAMLCFFTCIRADNTTILNSEYPWLSFPSTPKLPLPVYNEYLRINNMLIWYSVYGSANKPAVLFLHGGFANSNYWGLQVEKLRSMYRCILMDSRGHGRSLMPSDNITYDLMTSDVIALLDHLQIERTSLVGWSDGAIIGLNLAINYPSRLNSLFAFGANYNSQGLKDISTSAVFMAYLSRTQTEYQAMNPDPNYGTFYVRLTTMWSTLPNWSGEDFAKISKSLPVWIVDGDHEEAVYRNQTDQMAIWIQHAGELILPRSSHFSFIQTPEIFTSSLIQFLKEANQQSHGIGLTYSSTTIMLVSFILHFSLNKYFS